MADHCSGCGLPADQHYVARTPPAEALLVGNECPIGTLLEEWHLSIPSIPGFFEDPASHRAQLRCPQHIFYGTGAKGRHMFNDVLALYRQRFDDDGPASDTDEGEERPDPPTDLGETVRELMTAMAAQQQRFEAQMREAAALAAEERTRERAEHMAHTEAMRELDRLAFQDQLRMRSSYQERARPPSAKQAGLFSDRLVTREGPALSSFSPGKLIDTPKQFKVDEGGLHIVSANTRYSPVRSPVEIIDNLHRMAAACRAMVRPESRYFNEAGQPFVLNIELRRIWSEQILGLAWWVAQECRNDKKFISIRCYVNRALQTFFSASDERSRLELDCIDTTLWSLAGEAATHGACPACGLGPGTCDYQKDGTCHRFPDVNVGEGEICRHYISPSGCDKKQCKFRHPICKSCGSKHPSKGCKELRWQ